MPKDEEANRESMDCQCEVHKFARLLPHSDYSSRIKSGLEIHNNKLAWILEERRIRSLEPEEEFRRSYVISCVLSVLVVS